MRQFKRERGFLVFAQNGSVDYLRLAYGLALSLKATQTEVPHLSVVVTPGTEIPDQYRDVFDEIIDVPWVDEARNSEWKLENEWKAYHVTPYRETIKLDADMLFTHDIVEWWDILSRQDVWAATDVMTYRGHQIVDNHYRNTFKSNALPNIYTAMMYFKYSDTALAIFEMAETIFHNWEKLSYEYLDDTRPKEASTDVVFAMAMQLTGLVDECTFDGFAIPTFVHMKTLLQGWPVGSASENWLQHISTTLTPDLQLRIGRHQQTLPVHYHLKEFLTDDMIATYERALK